MAGVILVPSEHVPTESSGGEERPATAPKPPEEGPAASTAASQASSDLEGLQAALEDRRDGSATVRRLGLSTISDKPSLFRELDMLLAFDHHRVRSECAGMIARIAPQLGSEMESCMAIVLPRLVHNLGHPDPDVREAAANAIVVLARCAKDERAVLQAVVKHGLLNADAGLKQMVTRYLRLLFRPELARKDWREIVRCLIFLVVRHEDTKEEALQALQDLRALVGDEQFRLDLQQMDERDKEEAGVLMDVAGREPRYEFRFVEPGVTHMLQDKADWKARVRAIEELKLNVKRVSDPTAILEEAPRFLDFLAELLDDVNFKVTLVTLEIYAVLIDKLKWRVKPHLRTIVDTLVQHLGGNKVVVRSQAAKVLYGLMHSVGPAPVVNALCLNLASPGRPQSTKTREEILNAIILALLTFPSYEFDLRAICFAVAPSLLDPKCRVRQVALECLAVLAQAMGSSKLATIAAALDEAAKPHHDTDGALAAALARLARRQLPRIAADGQVEYSLRIPSSSSGRAAYGTMTSTPQGADVDWILAGSGTLGSGSASSRNTPIPPSPAFEQGVGKNQSASFPSSPAAPRRIVSPGHIKNWPPWSEVRSSSSGNLSDKLPDALPAPRKVRPPSKGPKSDGRHRTTTTELASTDANNLRAGSSPQQPKNQGSSHGMIYSGKQPTADRGSILGASRPLDKVAAMLGNNILPSKLHPVLSDNSRDKSARSLGGTSIVSLQSIPSFNPSNTWPGPASGSLPELPPKKKVLGPITDLRDAPIPMRPKLVRSSSGSKRARVPPIGQSPLNGTPDAVPDNEQQSSLSQHPSVKKAGRGEHQRNFYSRQFENPMPLGNSSFTQLPDTEPPRTINGHMDHHGMRNGEANSHRPTNYSPPSLPSLNGSSPSKSSISLINHEINSDDEEKPLDEYSRARGSVDSGVESLARPRSRMSSRSRGVRPRSLDLHSTFSMHPASSYEIMKVNADLSSSSSESPGWYDEDKGVQNRAISEVSSLSSSLEQLPDSPDDRTAAPSRFDGLYDQTQLDYPHEVDSTIDGQRTRIRQGSSLSWDLKSSSPASFHKQPKNRSISSFALHGAPQEEEGKVHPDEPPPYRRKPVPIYSPPLPHQKQASPISQAPFISGGSSLQRGAPLTNGYLVAPRVRTDHVLISRSVDASAGSEDFNVVGRGVNPPKEPSSSFEPSLPVSPPVPAHRSYLDSNANESPARLPAIQGTRLASNRRDSADGSFSTEDEDPNAMSLSRSTFNKMMSRKMEMMKEAERRKNDRQQKLQEQRRIWLQEQDTKKGELEEKQKNGQPNFRPKTPPGKPAAAKRKARYTTPTAQNGASLSSSTKSLASNSLDERLLRNPDEAIRTALANLQTDEWNVKCTGIKIITTLAQQQPAVLNNELHAINLALLAEVKNLRSTVSRAAIQSFSLLFPAAKKGMENDLEMICRTLLHKSGESNVFIKEDVEKALMQMVENVTPQKAVNVLILGGATHRNAAVRKTAAQFIAIACDKLGANRILSGSKDVTDKIVPTAAQFLMDGSPLTRYYGRKIIFMLLNHPEFDRVLKQHVQPSTLRNIQDILEGLKTKGLGTLPLNESASSRHFKGGAK